MPRAGSLIAGTVTRLKWDQCLGPAKETCWTRETFGGSKRAGRRGQQPRGQIVITHFGALRASADLAIIAKESRPLDGLLQYQNTRQRLRPKPDSPAPSADRSGKVTIELVQEALCDFQIKAAEALGEAIVHRREQFARRFGPALVLPQPREAGGGA